MLISSSRDSSVFIVRMMFARLCLESVEKYREGKIHKSEPEPRNGNVKYCLLLFIRGNIGISRTEFVYDKKHAIVNVCLYLWFQLNVRKTYILLQISFYA